MNDATPTPSVDLVLSHGYCLEEDPHEREIMMPFPPLGLLYLSSHLKERDFSVEIHDMTFSSFQAFEAHLRRVRPRVLGLYSNLLTRPRLLEMISMGKAAGAWVVLGGPEAAPHARAYLENGADVIVVGEGELTLEALLRHLPDQGKSGLDTIDGIVFLDAEGQVVRTKPRAMIADLDAQPLPDRAGIDLHRYLQVWREHHGQSTISLVTARGCPYTCEWCSHAVFGRSHRRRSPEVVADEIGRLIEDYRPDRLWFADDVFTFNRKWVLRFAEILEERNIRLPFECISRADRLDEEVADALVRLGCHRLWIGAESGSQRMLEQMQRRTSVDDVREKTGMLQQRGIEVGQFIMFGYEGETEEDLRDTIRHLQRSAPDLFLTTVAHPIKGTVYYDRVEERLQSDHSWTRRTDRDLQIAGRPSPRYYRWVTRWVVNSVNLHRELRGRRRLHRLPRLWLAKWAGWLGMRLFRNDLTPEPTPEQRRA